MRLAQPPAAPLHRLVLASQGCSAAAAWGGVGRVGGSACSMSGECRRGQDGQGRR